MMGNEVTVKFLITIRRKTLSLQKNTVVRFVALSYG